MPDIGNTIQNAAIDTTMGVAAGETAGNIATDVLLDELIDALVEQYAKASLQMQEKCDKYFGKYVEEDKKKRALLDAGKISKDDYRAWQNGKALGSKQWMDMRDTLAQDLTNCNEIAADIINDRKCDIYALNHNYGMYEIENNVGAYTSYTLYDHDTVERLIAQNPEILPKVKINIPKDLRWNKHLLTSAATQGILQGESIPAIAKRMASVTDMDKDAAIRNARTATTGAQNAGRVDSYKHAEKLGIKVTQIWISTLDGRTRTSHRHLMGQKRPLGKPFSNGLLFPGDPNGPGWEVYNCRCTLIAEPDGSGYDLEKTIDKNLSKKGMTFDEWLNEQPLSKHYGESKQHYLERYAKHKQQLPFSDWLEEAAAPDSVIQSVWGDKKMSQMYNEIKAQNTTDANKFYKELGKLGKPSEIWDKYLTGQLDAEDMKNFEDILKKYLPSSASVKVADNISDAVKVADDVTKGKAIHPKAQESLDKIKWEKGPEMSFEDADTFHVNPKYDNINKIYSVNCQTCTFAYEARRQGYNVEALGKDINHHNTYKLQQELGNDQANGWINTVTGKAPKNLIDPMVSGTNNLFKQLDAAVGKSGERYTMGVRWKTGGAHAINVDRDAAGNIRIIDNQRGKNEKHIWTGEKEIKSYFDSVDYLRSVYRVDDCVPNFEYLNMIVKKSDAVQAASKAAVVNEKTINVFGKKYTKTDLLDMDDDDLWEALSLAGYEEKFLEKFDGPNFKKNVLNEIFGNKPIDALDKSQFAKKKMSQVYTDIKMTDSKTANAFYKELQGMGKPSDVWDKYLKGELDPADVQKIEKHLAKKYSGLEEALPGESVTGLDIDTLSKKKVTGVYNDFVADGDKTTANQYYNTLKKIANDKGYKSQGDVWKKYLAGELDFDDIEKIDKFVIKKYSVTTTAGPNLTLTKADDIAKHNDEILKYYKDKSLNDPDVPMDIVGISVNKYFKAGLNNASDYWNKYKLGEIKDAEIDKVLGIKPVPVSAKIDDVTEIKKTLPTVLVKLSHEDLDLYNKVQGIISSAVPPNMIKAEYWQKYLKGEIINTDLDDVVKQYTKADLPDILKKTDLIDPMTGEVLDNVKEFEKIKKMPITDLDDMANKLTKDYYGLKVDDAKEILKGSGLNIPEKTTATNATNNIAEIAKKELSGSEDWIDVYAEIMDIDPDLTLAHEFKDIVLKIKNDEGFGKKYDVLNAYFNGTLKSAELDDIFTKIYKDKIPTASTTTNATTAVDIDAVKNKKVTAVYNEIKADLGTSEANAFYNKTLKEIGSKNSWSQGEVWKKYLAGDLDADDAKKIDDHLIKKYSKTVESPKPTFDKSAFDKKKMSQVYNEIKATDTATANKFYNDLKKMGKPSEVWDEYLKGNLPQDKVDIIEAHLKKKYSTGSQTAKTIQVATKSDELINAEEKLKAAQDELKAAEKALKDNVDTSVKWSGIWKEDVTLNDYASKKSAIAGKKQYYYDQIEELTHCIDDPDSWQFKKYGGEDGLNKKIAEYEKYIDDLNEYDQLGKYAEKYYDDIEKAKNKVTKAEQDVYKFSPSAFDPDAYSDKAKNATKFYTSADAADKVHRSYLDTIWNNLTDKEKYGIWEYTRNSHPMNKSLSGYHDDWSRSSFIGYDKTDWGHEDSWRRLPSYGAFSNAKKFGKHGTDYVDYHRAITDTTNAIEKSTLPQNTYLVRGSEKDGLAGLIEGNGLMSYNDAHQLLNGSMSNIKAALEGQVVKNHAFTSTGIAKGTGFSGEVSYEIYAPKGTKAIYVEPQSHFGSTAGKDDHIYKAGEKYSHVGGEAEMLIQRGTEYRITEITGSPRHLIVKMEVVNQPDYFVYGDEDTFNSGATRHKK